METLASEHFAGISSRGFESLETQNFGPVLDPVHRLQHEPRSHLRTRCHPRRLGQPLGKFTCLVTLAAL